MGNETRTGTHADGVEPAPTPPAGRRWMLRLVGPAIAIVLLSRVDLREVVDSLSEVRWTPLAWSLVLVFPLFLAKAWRWQSLLRAYGRRISLFEAMNLYMLGAGAGALTPGAVGDFWKGLAPAIGSRTIGLWTSAVDRLYDVAALGLMGVGAVIILLPSTSSRALAALLLCGAAAAAWMMRTRVLEFVGSRLPRLPDNPGAIDETVGAATALTMLATLIALVRFELLVIALGLPLSRLQTFFCFVLSSGAAALPLSVAGVGTRDVSLVGYLRHEGVSFHDAIALSSLCLLLLLWNGVVGAVVWLFRPHTV